MDSRAPKATEWKDVLEALHAVANTVTVRAHYGEGHPAVAQADVAVEKQFAKVLELTPEVVLALVDGEFVVSERPLPQLRERLHVLADTMVRHELECIVFQRGLRTQEATTLASLLASPTDRSGRLRDLAQQRMMHVLFRYVGAKASDVGAGMGTGTAYLVPQAEAMLVAVARALAAGDPVDVTPVHELASRIVDLAKAHAFALDQRAWTRSLADEAAHAVNVAQIGAAIALDTGYTERECVDVTAAALLHDVGHLFVPEEIRGIPEPLLDSAQRPVFRNHTYAGASLLLSAGCPPLWVAAAFEHHRGIDGGGYPGLEAKTPPHDLVRVVAIANYFDRKRTRLEGRADEPDEILRAALELEPRFFGKGLTARFVRALGIFPPGTTVELSDREPAVVARAHAGDPVRPQVRVLRGPRSGKLIDLREVAPDEGRFERSITRSVLPPLFVPADIVAPAADEVLAEEAPSPEMDAADDPWSAVEPVRRRRTRASPGPSVGPSSDEVARQELSGMGALLDDLLTVPVGAMAPPPAAATGPQSTTSVPAMLAVTAAMSAKAIAAKPSSRAIPAVNVTVPPGAMESQRPRAPSREMPAARISAPPVLKNVPVTTSAPPPAAAPEEIEILMMVGQWQEALDACEAWLAANPADAAVEGLRGRCLEKLGGGATPSAAPVAPRVPPAASRAAPAMPPQAPSFDVRAHLTAVPALAVPEAATYALPLGSEARFVLTLVDGVSDLETIADASGLPHEQALAILGDLVAHGVLAIR